mgnify:FL=1
MKLNSMRIENFKGIAAFEFTPNGENVIVYGDNATGKTTLVDAFTWLLFDKDSQGAKDFNVKTLDAGSGLAIQAIDHSVEATLTTDDGDTVVLQKIYREKWTKKRGSADRVFDGHTTEHFVNGVPKSKGEYQAVVGGFAPEKLFRMLTSPTFFSEQLTWQARRELLVNAFGEVSDEEIMAASPELAPLEERLQRHSVDDLKKVELATRKRINEELNAIPGRVDEAIRAMPATANGANPAVLASKAQKLSAEIEALRQQKAAITSGGQIAEKRRELAELDAAMLTLKNKATASVSGAVAEELAAARKILADLVATEMDLQNRLSWNKTGEDKLKREIADLKRENQAIVTRWQEHSAKRFVAGGSCPTCGQDYPEHLVARQEADFNRAKAQALCTIADEGNANKQAIEDREAKLQAIQAESNATLATSIEEVAGKTKDQRAVVEALEARMSEAPKVEELPEYQEIGARQSAILEEISALSAGTEPAIAELQAQIEAKGQELTAVNREITDIEVAATQQYRVDELKAREKELARHFEASEKSLYLIEQFQRARTGALEESINSQFSLVRWKMFDNQINGGLVETCVCTVDGVPYSDLNNAARVQAGLDIISTMAEHFNFYPPVWVDNRESIVRLPEMQQQVISLVVSEADKELRVETAA